MKFSTAIAFIIVFGSAWIAGAWEVPERYAPLVLRDNSGKVIGMYMDGKPMTYADTIQTYDKIVAQIHTLDLRRADNGEPIELKLQTPSFAAERKDAPESVVFFNKSSFYLLLRAKKENEIDFSFVKSIVVIDSEKFTVLRQKDESLSVIERTTNKVVASYNTDGKLPIPIRK
jgi:hypothetical protein